jgi:periodic tryptophan protein 1
MSEDDAEDYKIKKSDGLAVVGKVENEFSSLEVYVYEKEKYNCYVHHEV